MFPGTLASLMVGTMACVNLWKLYQNLIWKLSHQKLVWVFWGLEEATPKKSMKCFLFSNYFWMNKTGRVMYCLIYWFLSSLLQSLCLLFVSLIINHNRTLVSCFTVVQFYREYCLILLYQYLLPIILTFPHKVELHSPCFCDHLV